MSFGQPALGDAQQQHRWCLEVESEGAAATTAAAIAATRCLERAFIFDEGHHLPIVSHPRSGFRRQLPQAGRGSHVADDINCLGLGSDLLTRSMQFGGNAVVCAGASVQYLLLHVQALAPSSRGQLGYVGRRQGEFDLPGETIRDIGTEVHNQK